jgi:hypothetical protein
LVAVTFLALLVPVAVLGLIVWAVVGFTRRGGGEPFTLASATALYARVLVIVGVVMALAGVGTILKAAFGFINIAYSYYAPTVYAPAPSPAGTVAPLEQLPNYLEQQRSQDLVLGITLLGVGVLVAVAHHYLARAVAHMGGGSPEWVTRGALLALTVVTAIAGIWSAALGLNQVLGYFIIGPSQSQQPWGESLGMAIAFVPAWIYAMTRLVRDLRRPQVGAPSGQGVIPERQDVQRA